MMRVGVEEVEQEFTSVTEDMEMQRVDIEV